MVDYSPPPRIVYRRGVDEHGIDVSWYVKVDAGRQEVVWGFHPHLPEGMHWKKGDESGLGSDHNTDGRQSFDEFLCSPLHEIDDASIAEITAAIDAAR